MELIPRALVVAAFFPPNMPGMGGLDADKINRIWSELAPRYRFTQLQMAPDGTGATFLGSSPEDGLTIQPPLVQLRSGIQTTADEAGRGAQAMLGVVARHAAAPQLFNLAVRLIYSAPLPNNDARGFVLGKLLADGAEHLEQLGGLADVSWGGIKYVVPQVDRQYTVIIEPAHADQMKSLYIDVDTAFPPGPVDLQTVARHVEEVRDFIAGPTNAMLDQIVT